MMKSLNFLFTTILLLALEMGSSLAQQPNYAPGGSGGPVAPKALIKGNVVDAGTQLPLEFATVTIFEQKDSSLVTGSITGEKGEFLIETKPGSYYALIEFLSYKHKAIGGILLTKDEPVADLGNIALELDASTLAEVEVRAEKSQMQLTLDKKVFNVGKDLANAGGTAEDILDNVPSVTVDIEGNVSLRGSGNVRILVDGKPSGLIGISNTNGLRQLPANLIDRVEVITNPSARYEAEGMAGIINIVLKKQQQKGLNGSFDLTLGTPERYGTSVNLNYRKDHFNFFINYGLRYRKSPGTGSQYSEFTNGDTLEITNQTRERNRGGWTNSVRFGSDYFFNPKNILTTSFSYRRSNEDNLSVVNYNDYIFNLDTPTGSSIRTDNQKEKEPNLEYALTYRKTFDKKDHELTFDARYENSEEKQHSNYLENYFDATGASSNIADLQQRSENTEKQKDLRLQADYVYPFGKEGKFETGYLGSIRKIQNDYLVEELTDVAWETLTNLSNNFMYDENIQAAYVSFGNKIDKFSFQGGLRMEYSGVKTQLLQTNEINDRSYANFFPTLHLTYDLADQNAVQLSYSRRIRRPRFWDLNPFFTFSDSRNQFSGNPNIDPEFTDSYEANHIKYWENGSLTSGIFYRHTTDVIERITTYDNEGNSFTKPENLSTRDDYGLEFTGSFDPFKFWRINGDLNFFRSITNGENLGQSFDADSYTWFGRFTSRLTLWKKLDVQTTFNYRAPRKTTQGENKAMYNADLGMSIDVLKNNGTLTLSSRDLFNTRRWRHTSEGENFYTRGDFQWHSRSISLTLNYRLNQKKQRDQEGPKGERTAPDSGGMEF